MIPYANQADIHDNGPRMRYGEREWDEDGYERTERRIGSHQCPKCELWWPIIEDPDAWVWNEATQRWDADGWWGGVHCDQCELLFVNQPDGSAECFDLSKR